MPNFCPHCGTAVTENSATNCLSCEKPLSGSSETTKNDSFNDSKEKLFNFAKNVKELSTKVSEDLRSDETKAKIKVFANQAQTFASEKTKDLKNEFEKINEARKTTANEAKDMDSKSTIENSKIIAKSFWSKLTSKQKTILIGSFLLLFILLMQFADNVESDAKKTAEFACALNNYSKMDELSVDKLIKEADDWNKKMDKKYSSPDEKQKYLSAAGGDIKKSCVR